MLLLFKTKFHDFLLTENIQDDNADDNVKVIIFFDLQMSYKFRAVLASFQKDLKSTLTFFPILFFFLLFAKQWA